MLSQSKVSTSSSSLLDRKVEEITTGLSARYAKQLHSISEGNTAEIVEYIDYKEKESANTNTCQDCNKTFSSIEELTTHYKKEHPESF
ncbi:MAG: hypothetical protein M3146_09775 [Thermoproteota archaeon]|nr:hypothetical protein [Thermoproteota archaeon]